MNIKQLLTKLKTLIYSKSEVDTRLNDYIPKSGGEVITGSTLSRTVNNDELRFDGGTTWGNGASISLSGKDRPDANAVMTFHTSDGTNTSELLFAPNGTFVHRNNDTVKNIAMYEDVIPRSGGAVLTGNVIGRNKSSGDLTLSGGDERNHGGNIMLCAAQEAYFLGAVCIIPNKNGRENYMWVFPDGTLTWTGTAIQYVSDQRLKQQISNIDDKLLDAWEDVLPCQFKYNDAVDQKGDTARLHTGYVVQQIDEACKSHNLDISAYGLYCHEEYPERTEEVEVTQDDGTTKKETKVIEPAREHYSLRYTETLVVECAYLRREVSRLKQQNENLEQRLKMLENK